MLEKKDLIIITGPTGVGKTELSIEFAKKMGGEIISADSIQVYRYMDIGSAKVTKEEMQGVPHYLVDVIDPADDFNIFRFQQMAFEAMEQIYQNGHIPVIVGGTGFYIQSVLYHIDFNTEDDDRLVRNRFEKLADEKGMDYLYGLLREIDPASADAIHPNNRKRIIRALEYHENTGEKMSFHNERERCKTSPYRFRYFVLNRNRDILYERIEKRIDQMMEDGLVAEVKQLLDMGYTRDLVSMQGLGYKEIASYLEGEMSKEEAVAILKRDTRHFAKRQLTWFRREKDVVFLNYEDYDNDKHRMCEAMIQNCRQAGIFERTDKYEESDE